MAYDFCLKFLGSLYIFSNMQNVAKMLTLSSVVSQLCHCTFINFHQFVKWIFTQHLCNLTYVCKNVHHFLVPPMGHYVPLISPTQVKFGATYLTPVLMPICQGRHLVDYRFIQYSLRGVKQPQLYIPLHTSAF